MGMLSPLHELADGRDARRAQQLTQLREIAVAVARGGDQKCALPGAALRPAIESRT
jgi:hypothetical protein